MRSAFVEEYSRGRSFPVSAFQGFISGAPEVSGHASPVQMHIHRQGRGRSVVGEAALLLADLGQAHAHTSQFFWHVHAQIAGLSQLLKILSEKSVLPVVDRCALSTPV